MSEVKVDTISERTTDAGVTIEGVKVEDGVATFQTAAGSPLVFEGATADAFETTFAITDPTADRTITFPDSSFTVPTSGGITHASQWRLTADFTNAAEPIASNLAEAAASFGSSMTESSGIFTFPVTGTWNVEFNIYGSNATYYYSQLYIQTTTDDSSYATVAFVQETNENGADAYGTSTSVFFNVTDKTQCKCKFFVSTNNTALDTYGDANSNETYMNFIRLGDST